VLAETFFIKYLIVTRLSDKHINQLNPFVNWMLLCTLKVFCFNFKLIYWKSFGFGKKNTFLQRSQFKNYLNDKNEKLIAKKIINFFGCEINLDL